MNTDLITIKMGTKKSTLKILLIIAGYILILTVSCKKNDNGSPNVDHTGETGTVTDIDGNVYNTIGIGSQIWMVQNLNVTHYRNSNAIDTVTDNTAWNNRTSGACCNYDNFLGYSTTYGKLYNWHAVNDSRNIAPAGWHVPTREEWDILIDFAGGKAIAGSKLKETGITHWISDNTDATNEFGFQGLPGGWRLNMGDFFYIHEKGFWWTKSNDYLPGGFAYSYGLDKDSTSITRYATIQNFGLSVKCVKD
jgi:uncharacterized protein (TIGR02145 family)